MISPIDHTPAARAGLESGDVVVSVDGESVKGVKLRDLVNRLRGEPGTEVSLAVQRGDTPPTTYDLTRAVIEVESVSSRLLDDDVGYLRISQFQVNTATEVEQAVKRLKFDTKAGLKGLVLDLRNNPGGILQQSVAVADSFLTSGLIVYTDGRPRSSKLRFTASGGDLLDGAPIAVLINRGSASASEIVAGALQDHKRAVVLGGRSFGKGSVQSVMPISEAAAIKLTTALYYTPSGRSIHNTGIAPGREIRSLGRRVGDARGRPSRGGERGAAARESGLAPRGWHHSANVFRSALISAGPIRAFDGSHRRTSRRDHDHTRLPNLPGRPTYISLIVCPRRCCLFCRYAPSRARRIDIREHAPF